MTDAGDRGEGLPGGSGAAGDQHRRREPPQGVMGPGGPIGMSILVSRAAERLWRVPRGGGNVVAGIYALSVLAVIIALGIFFIV